MILVDTTSEHWHADIGSTNRISQCARLQCGHAVWSAALLEYLNVVCDLLGDRQATGNGHGYLETGAGVGVGRQQGSDTMRG